MNERIRELAKDAGIHFHKGGTLDAGPNGIAKFVLYSDIEKFAELIVRECIKESMEEIVSDEDIPEINDPCAREYLKGNNQGIVDAVVRFRNHFGVEE